MILHAMLLGIAVGVVGETTANLLSLWTYAKQISPLLNILGMFGALMGTVSLLSSAGWGAGGWVATGVVGFVIGYGYEWANFLRLAWWTFPNDRFLIFRGRQGCALSVGVLWGIVPLLIALLTRVPWL